MENKFRVALKGFVAHKPVSQGGNMTVLGVGVNITPTLTQYYRVLVFNKENTKTLMKYADRGSVVELKGNLSYVVKKGCNGAPKMDVTIKTGWATLCPRGGEQYIKAEVVGNLAANPRGSETWNKVTVSNFDVLVDIKDRKNAKPRTIGTTVAAFGKLASACNSYIYRGRQVQVEGDLRIQEYQDRNGRPQVGLAVKARDVRFLAHTRAYRRSLEAAAA